MIIMMLMQTEADGDDNDNDGQVGCSLLQHQRIEITL